MDPVKRERSYSHGLEGRDELSEQVIGAAIEVHRALGPGLLESVYQCCLAEELRFRGLSFNSELPLPIRYRGRCLDAGFRLDLVVESRLLVELKSIERVLPVHVAQVLTYLRVSGIRRGLLINFNAPRLTFGVRRVSL
jgi:GxxExxY protein